MCKSDVLLKNNAPICNSQLLLKKLRSNSAAQNIKEDFKEDNNYQNEIFAVKNGFSSNLGIYYDTINRLKAKFQKFKQNFFYSSCEDKKSDSSEVSSDDESIEGYTTINLRYQTSAVEEGEKVLFNFSSISAKYFSLKRELNKKGPVKVDLVSLIKLKK